MLKPHIELVAIVILRVKKWQRSFFYVRNNSPKTDLIGLPPFLIGPPTKMNWGYTPSEKLSEIKLSVKRVEALMKEGFRGADMVGTFISRRVLPLQLRSHKICHMSGPLDPTRISTFDLKDEVIWQRCKDIAQIRMPEWSWGMRPYNREHFPPVVGF